MKLYLIFPVLLGLVLLTASSTRADIGLYFDVRVNAGAGAFSYFPSATPSFFPGNPELQFTTGRISSGDNQFVMTTNAGGWAIQQPIFSTLSSLVSSVELPWSMVLDDNLPTERNYTFTLNLGELPNMDLTPPVIISPTHKSILQTLTPTFSLSLPAQYSYFMQLGRFVGNTSTIVASPTLPGGTATWSPPAPLAIGNYYLHLEKNNIGVSEMAFSAPVDTISGNPIPNFQSGGSATLEANALFSVVPEPASVAILLSAALAILPVYRARRGKTSTG